MSTQQFGLFEPLNLFDRLGLFDQLNLLGQPGPFDLAAAGHVAVVGGVEARQQRHPVPLHPPDKNIFFLLTFMLFALAAAAAPGAPPPT